jgi:hypothetical protein
MQVGVEWGRYRNYRPSGVYRMTEETKKQLQAALKYADPAEDDRDLPLYAALLELDAELKELKARFEMHLSRESW